jgi:hypothetical protein
MESVNKSLSVAAGCISLLRQLVDDPNGAPEERIAKPGQRRQERRGAEQRERLGPVQEPVVENETPMLRFGIEQPARRSRFEAEYPSDGHLDCEHDGDLAREVRGIEASRHSPSVDQGEDDDQGRGRLAVEHPLGSDFDAAGPVCHRLPSVDEDLGSFMNV